MFEKTGFQIVRAEEAYRPIKFYDIGAFVWFARIIEWEFLDFSIDRCFEKIVDEWDSEQFNIWFNYHLSVCSEKSTIDMSNHVVIAGVKR